MLHCARSYIIPNWKYNEYRNMNQNAMQGWYELQGSMKQYCILIASFDEAVLYLILYQQATPLNTIQYNTVLYPHCKLTQLAKAGKVELYRVMTLTWPIIYGT